MTDGPLVSVIVPVFNAHKNLEECLDSLGRQTLAPIEIIAVDDASTDGSGAILRRWAANESIRVIAHPTNQGVSAARNTGLAAARGDYVAFVDADDLVHPTMYGDLLRAARAHRSDLAICGVQMIDTTGKLRETVPPPLPTGTRLTPEAVRESLHEAWARRLLWYPFRSIYARDLLTASRVEFDPRIRKGEDSVFNLRALLLADGVTAVESALYSYRKHPSSATARALPNESANLEHLAAAVTCLYAEHAFEERAYRDFYRHVLRSDLPTALVRVISDESARREIDGLLRADPVRRAFHSERISQLGVPLSVAALLVLAKHRMTGPLMGALRVSRGLKRARHR